MWIAIGLALVCALLVGPRRSRRRTGARPLLEGTGAHWRRNYASRRTFLRLGAAAAGAAVLAYSGADTAFDRFHARQVRSSATDRLGRAVYHGGNRYWFLVWLLVGAVDAWWHTSWFTRWGRRNFEAMLVGLPTLWTLQRGLGSNRPTDPDPDPRWRPLADDNAASGHAFIGAIPWLTLAHALHRPWARGLSRAASGLTGWSRLNDRKHYLSQVVLGWTIAWNAVEATDDGPAAEESP